MIGIVIGVIFGGFIVFVDIYCWMNKIKKGEKKMEDFEVEDWLFLVMIGGVGFVVSDFV